MSTKNSNPRLTIKFSDRPPVTITKSAWPVVAKATYEDYDNEYRFQAFRTWDASVIVRQHADGRTIVYATYWFSTAWQNERDVQCYSGQMLSPEQGRDVDVVCATIRQVCGGMSDDCKCDWNELAADCINDMPADRIDVSPVRKAPSPLRVLFADLRSKLSSDVAATREAARDAIEALLHVRRCLADVE